MGSLHGREAKDAKTPARHHHRYHSIALNVDIAPIQHFAEVALDSCARHSFRSMPLRRDGSPAIGEKRNGLYPEFPDTSVDADGRA